MNVTMDIVPVDDAEFAAMWQEGWTELIASGETDYTAPPPFGGKFDIALLIRADGEAAAIRAYHDWGTGVAQGTWWLYRKDLERGDVRAILQPYAQEGAPVSVLYPAQRHVPAKLRALIDFLVQITRSG